jgi:Protein of unknown function (DUF1838)
MAYLAGNNEEKLETFIRIRASQENTDQVCWFRGKVYAYIPGETHIPLFTLEGYNIARAEKVEGGYDFITREAVFYKDPVTDQILDTWTNPWTGETCNVIHILNDPVNAKFRAEQFGVPMEAWGDDVHTATDVFLKYPNPLPKAQWPRESTGDVYQGAELFRFIASRSELEGDAPSVACNISWVRFAPWTPWMLAGDQPGNLVYHTGGKKLMGGYSELPADIRAKIESDHPEYQTAPSEFSTPNETSWTYYKKQSTPQ